MHASMCTHTVSKASDDLNRMHVERPMHAPHAAPHAPMCRFDVVLGCTVSKERPMRINPMRNIPVHPMCIKP